MKSSNGYGALSNGEIETNEYQRLPNLVEGAPMFAPWPVYPYFSSLDVQIGHCLLDQSIHIEKLQPFVDLTVCLPCSNQLRGWLENPRFIDDFQTKTAIYIYILSGYLT